MIVLSKIKDQEYSKVNLILEKESIKDCLDNGIIYTLKDNDAIVGVGKIRNESDYGVLEYLVIKEESRGSNLGDALLRTLLFKAETSGITKIFYTYKDNYLLKKGFVYNKDDHKDLYDLCVQISSFFDGGSCDGKDRF